MSFKLLSFARNEPQHACFDESLIALAAQQGPSACLWEAEQGLVVPRSYRRFSAFSDACAQFEQAGWPVTVRQSGGGIVPQGPGVINLSLAYTVQGKPLDHSDAAYLLICRIISQALQAYGVASHPQAVEGSFCDGRYNLAVGRGAGARKIAGTAQVWRRHPAASSHNDQQIVLVHALILAHVDVQALSAQANRFEQAIGNDKRYAADRIASLHTLQNNPGLAGADWLSALGDALARQVNGADSLSKAGGA
ncbi:lipoate--protein ligase family protein [Pusillimonas sp. SM2304]|uniref:lipoyl protein ligase domain-containing protein n=1 Tax=Pusillimonas sp. SM2304 TaxID=3073241 RepID=UPI002874987E|nr:lipoate--protein ligase family protein [Pusillimonas sp. SM2304]MDS1141083.1 lipoate--protein ligase family protein [Pusillimonas sp. SM2304]